MTKLKVLTFVGTRPEIIRLSRVISKLDKYCDHQLVHTGQNYDYELNEIFFNELNIRAPDIYMGAAGASPSITVGNIIIEADDVLKKFKPDAVLILGDTNSALASIACKKNKVPIFHMEAGNRCFDQRVPEESNRRIVDHISDINMTYSSISRENLIREGIPADRVIKTGSPMKEVLDFYSSEISQSDVLKNLGLTRGNYFLVSAHREENVDSEKRLCKLLEILNLISDLYKLPIIFSAHPRTRIRLDSLGLKLNPLIQLCKPFGFFDYIQLQLSARCVLSDSGTLTEESNILNFPALALRDAQERPEGFEEGAVMLVGLNHERIFQGLELLIDQERFDERTISIVDDYNIDNVSEKVLRIIYSHVDYTNRVVWGRQVAWGD